MMRHIPDPRQFIDEVNTLLRSLVRDSKVNPDNGYMEEPVWRHAPANGFTRYGEEAAKVPFAVKVRAIFLTAEQKEAARIMYSRLSPMSAYRRYAAQMWRLSKDAEARCVARECCENNIDPSWEKDWASARPKYEYITDENSAQLEGKE